MRKKVAELPDAENSEPTKKLLKKFGVPIGEKGPIHTRKRFVPLGCLPRWGAGGAPGKLPPDDGDRRNPGLRLRERRTRKLGTKGLHPEMFPSKTRQTPLRHPTETYQPTRTFGVEVGRGTEYPAMLQWASFANVVRYSKRLGCRQKSAHRQNPAFRTSYH